MSFKNWPNEILLQLLSDDVFMRKDLFSLAQVSRQFSEVTAAVLYRDIWLSFEVDTGRRLYFVKRAIEDRLLLAPLMRSLELEWIYNEDTASLFRNNLHSILDQAPRIAYVDLSIRVLEKDKYEVRHHRNRIPRRR